MYISIMLYDNICETPKRGAQVPPFVGYPVSHGRVVHQYRHLWGTLLDTEESCTSATIRGAPC